MNAFPLFRSKWTNEHIAAAVFIVLILYMLPQWSANPAAVFDFLYVLSIGLTIDVTANFVRYKRPVCAVSAAVTAAILYILTPGVPLWGRLLGIIFALLVGKHFWGGAGKNIVNPAITGLLFVGLLFNLKFPAFAATFLIVPATILSLPFLKIRPYASIGFMTGMCISLFLNHGLTVSDIVSYGVVFWSCLVITDPVTVTPHPLYGAAAGFLSGFVPLYYSGSAAFMALGILFANLFSCLADEFCKKSYNKARLSFKKNKIIPFSADKSLFYDLTGEKNGYAEHALELSKDDILNHIKANGVFGLGGAAFPAYKKIMSAIESSAAKKYLIINGVECDPGLIHDKWLLYNYTDEIYRGIQLLCRCMKFDSVIMAVKTAEGLNYPKDLIIREVPDYYPVGAERILVKEILNKTVVHDAIPSKEGILVMNVQTVLSIYEAVCKNKKADTKFLTVTDIRKKMGKVVRVRLGTKIHDIIEAVCPQPGIIFCGGGLMQARAADDEDIIDKEINFLAAADYPRYKESPLCSKCGLCSMNCPAGLRVNAIAALVDEGKLEEAGRLHAVECIECGSCSFVCLAERNLSARLKRVKEYLKSK